MQFAQLVSVAPAVALAAAEPCICDTCYGLVVSAQLVTVAWICYTCFGLVLSDLSAYTFSSSCTRCCYT